MKAQSVVALEEGGFAARLSGDRLHLEQGPINLVIKAYGPRSVVERAYALATACFRGLLAGLVVDLPLLREPVNDGNRGKRASETHSATARRMLNAVAQYRDVFVTPMACVAGSVADTMMSAINKVPGLEKAYINNGGDIAVYLGKGQSLDIGVVPSLRLAVPEAKVRLHHDEAVGGLATSGWDGHSHSLGVADAVTVLAHSAAAADVAATLIANQVTTDHPAIARRPANQLRSDSDLGHRPVTVAVGKLPRNNVRQALQQGVDFAQDLQNRGLIIAALMAVQGQWCMVGKETFNCQTNTTSINQELTE